MKRVTDSSTASIMVYKGENGMTSSFNLMIHLFSENHLRHI